jgi:hypothetical protein
MFNKIEGGSIYSIPDNSFGFVYECWMPPIGWGVNSITGELEETDIIKRSDIPEEQFFERFKLPSNWKEKEKAEKERMKVNKKYRDPELEKIRHTEWKRRLLGVWFWNYNPFKKESELLYITGAHYLYCTYWVFQGKYMDFRITDMEIWYILKYCEQDPDCLGLNFLTRRRLGKTAISGCWAYERTSRRPTNQHCGIQSKDDSGAEEVMKKAVVQPWKKLPAFFRPVYDLMKGDDPNELRFFNTSRRGSVAEQEREEEDALESWIDYAPATEGYYDGYFLSSYISDEAGKVEKKISIKTRQDVVRYCSEIAGKMEGMQLYTTTVEADENTADEHEFQELVYDSNPLSRNENNRTTTGLYTYFLPAHKAFYFDNIYGYPNVESALTFLLNTRKSLEEQGKLRMLASAKRKNPMTLKEAFSVDGHYSLYNPILIQEQLDKCNWGEKRTEFGDLVWKDGFEFERPIINDFGEKIGTELNEIVWHPNPNGRWEKLCGWQPEEPNKVVKRNEVYLPNNYFTNVIGCDPFKYDKTKDKRRSNCAAFNYQLKDELNPSEYDNTFTLRYSFRPESTRMSNYDILKMAWWCGSRVLFERNVNHWKNDFIDAKCAAFLMYMPGEEEPGIITDGAGKVAQTISNYTESYINENIGKVWFERLMNNRTGWLGFKVDDTQKYDEPMAAGFTLIAAKGLLKQKTNNKSKKIESIIPLRKAI